ncbi:MAG: bifunctional diaminohydroxyphosphoribosylaminopyrimidine deaminase/5-amino-6-(5-phosphoribosylamino)uracil reductase RibD, partial [Candidatus Cloacimonetes bacterium]|nr:bifunctional diaminohydroxyphosphoribosylaminopyrimidine deaminase/5-amino-6-(5-phosphoribosylamino)uracil reductase RibD [Candidatus Cloacimonadota bacterium]
MYVTLEPCSHYGKTPPCVNAIIAAGIKNVYVGLTDPNPLVNGNGINILRENNINVEYGYFAEVIEKQLEYYMLNVRHKRPFYIMKNAVSFDGNISLMNGDSRWITGIKSRNTVHKLRNEVDGVLTGVNTVIIDNPELNVRLNKKIKSDPVRIILDTNFSFPIDCKLADTSGEKKTIIFTAESSMKSIDSQNKKRRLEEKNIEIYLVGKDDKGLNLREISGILFNLEIRVIMIEAGPELSSSFLEQNLVDKFYYFIAPKIIGGNRSVFSFIKLQNLEQSYELEIDSIKKSGEDYLLIGYPNRNC